MSFDRDRRDRSNDDSERNERTQRTRAQAQTQRGARPYQYLTRVGQPSRDQAAILDQMILRRGLENVQELGERGELPEGCNTPMGEQVRVARVRSSWKAGVELDTESAMRSVEAQAESDLAGETATPEVVRRVISQPGRPLEGSVREEMEQRMGDSFSDVQLHTGPEAAKAASALEARAFTTGNHVVFNRGEYNPESPEGKYLLAHELAHVRQQTGGKVSMLPQEGSSLVIDPDPELEREADEVARKALEGEGPIVAHRLGMDVSIQRAVSATRRGFLRGRFSKTEEPTEEPEGPSIPADPEVLAAEVEQLKAGQAKVMETLTEAKPGASSDGNWFKAATKGSLGALAGAGAGAAIGAAAGSVIPVIGTAAGAAVGAAVSGVASDVTKEGIDYLADNRPGGKGAQLEGMYEEIQQMYLELKDARETTGSTRFD
ncbi:DUF4157 domain-containing protein [Natronobiforma cellulositropha]|uniref:eCIS core domain-containing protein n=1 Tax=Natronobiforma cellulositropha TaxID=1679076 RepID=UPI0021D59A1E|nr:DUF4157 domain-containing protein [Natronobiforma cellulositropha]